MRIYRLAQEEYKDDLSGRGSFLYGGRWNSKGLYALYAAEHISLAVLELVVNFNRSSAPLKKKFHLLSLEIPEEKIGLMQADMLKKNWFNDPDYTRYIGDLFLGGKELLAMKIPSAVIPEEFNYIINPQHEDFKKVKKINDYVYGLDNRLLV